MCVCKTTLFLSIHTRLGLVAVANPATHSDYKGAVGYLTPVTPTCYSANAQPQELYRKMEDADQSVSTAPC